MATTRRNTISLDHKILYVPSAKYAKIEAERSESKYTALSAQSSEERSFVPISRNGSIKSNALSRQNSIDNSRNSSRPSSTKRRSVQDINHSANPPSIQVNQSRNVLAKGASASNLLGTCQSSNTSTTAVTQLPVVNADNIPQSVKEEIDKYINFSVYSIPVYTLDPTLVELEKKIIVDAASNMKYRSGITLENLAENLPRKKMYVSLSGPSIITQRIVIGSRLDAANEETLKSLGITHILNAAQQLPNSFPDKFIYLKLNIIDAPDENILKFFLQASSFLNHVHNVKGRVLVHCISGVSRSVTLVMLYLIMQCKITLKQVYTHVHNCRPYISPNDGFKLQLALFEVYCLGKSSVARCVDKEWRFYEWNRLKSSFENNALAKTENSSCCIIS